MGKITEINSILKSINNHPLAGKHRLKAYRKFIFWQLWNVFNSKEKKVSFTNKTILVAKKSMKGATGNIYLGLHEFADMGFLLHFLRKKDVFLDIGANIGSYMILASGHVGSRSIAFEPIPKTFKALQKNIHENGINGLVKAFNIGVGSKKGTLIFTESFDTVNHVLLNAESDSHVNKIEIPVITIDEILSGNEVPALVKIDVEGFETEVLKGMESTLSNSILKAIIIELNGSGGRYNFDERKIHEQLINYGFNSFEYDPLTRKLKAINNPGPFNTLYLRDMKFIDDRISSGDKVSIFSEIF